MVQEHSCHEAAHETCQRKAEFTARSRPRKRLPSATVCDYTDEVVRPESVATPSTQIARRCERAICLD